jgi:hypothetical protein
MDRQVAMACRVGTACRDARGRLRRGWAVSCRACLGATVHQVAMAVRVGRERRRPGWGVLYRACPAAMDRRAGRGRLCRGSDALYQDRQVAPDRVLACHPNPEAEWVPSLAGPVAAAVLDAVWGAAVVVVVVADARGSADAAAVDDASMCCVDGTRAGSRSSGPNNHPG